MIARAALPTRASRPNPECLEISLGSLNRIGVTALSFMGYTGNAVRVEPRHHFGQFPGCRVGAYRNRPSAAWRHLRSHQQENRAEPEKPASRPIAAVGPQFVGHGREHIDAFHRQTGRQWVRIVLPNNGCALPRTASSRCAPLKAARPCRLLTFSMVGCAGACNATADNDNFKCLTHAPSSLTNRLKSEFMP